MIIEIPELHTVGHYDMYIKIIRYFEKSKKLFFYTMVTDRGTLVLSVIGTPRIIKIRSEFVEFQR